MAALRDEVADIGRRLDDADPNGEELAHRERSLLLVVGFLRRLLELHLEFVDEVERELGPGGST
jgi:hypothetical protein